MSRRHLLIALLLAPTTSQAFAPPHSLRLQPLKNANYYPSLHEKVSQDEDEEEIKLPPTIFSRYERPNDINTDSFGPLLPIAKAVDDATGGWGLSYADLHPATPRTR